jgi:hypothetical protein
MAGPAEGRGPAISLSKAGIRDRRDGAPRALARGDPDKPGDDQESALAYAATAS